MTIFCSSIVAVFLLGMANDANADSADAVSSRLQVHVRFSNEQTLFSGWLFRILGIQIPTWKFVEFFTDMLGNGVHLSCTRLMVALRLIHCVGVVKWGFSNDEAIIPLVTANIYVVEKHRGLSLIYAWGLANYFFYGILNRGAL